MSALTPVEVVEAVTDAGAHKGTMRVDKIFLSGVSAGCLLAFACGTTLSTNTAPSLQQSAPGLIRTIGALVFPYGLCMIILTGADLCTGSFMFTTVAVLQRRLSWYRMLFHWLLTFLGNLAGSLLVVSLIFGYGEVFSTEPYKSEVIAFATKKQVVPNFGMVVLRGIGCNWLVVGIWWPTFAFVSLGFDHVVANMTFIPMAIFLGAPKLTVSLYIWKGIVPAFLGNVVGGGVFCGMYYFYMYSPDAMAFLPHHHRVTETKRSSTDADAGVNPSST
ncbi:hypothetical protein QQS21_002559 [Conoideocrella luteorostrata]|uniref:Formate/nitrite transporter n=1 Tax=Conoideocrella luteorostrata TaxID=1105319 RepID=A0AAJ0CUU0_9HYPO|nr:hypothetical protein QQS21_002559 [Conoideocrella luteorostrata]